jgi:hypothetical protein
VIRNTVIHIANEQPLVADLFGLPGAGDVSLICTNLRTLGGKRPVFADRSESVFVFPYDHIRFLEIAPEALAASAASAPSSAGSNGSRDGAAAPASGGPDALAAILGEIGLAVAAGSSGPPAKGIGAPGDAPAPDDGAARDPGEAVESAAPADDLDVVRVLDEAFLRRVRAF